MSNVKMTDSELFYSHNITSLAIIWMNNNKKDQISKYASLINFGFKMNYSVPLKTMERFYQILVLP